MGTPSHHPCFIDMFHCRPSSYGRGYPSSTSYGNPHFTNEFMGFFPTKTSPGAPSRASSYQMVKSSNFTVDCPMVFWSTRGYKLLVGASLTVLPWLTFVDNGGWKYWDSLDLMLFFATKARGIRLRSALQRPIFIGQTWCPVVFVDVFCG